MKCRDTFSALAKPLPTPLRHPQIVRAFEMWCEHIYSIMEHSRSEQSHEKELARTA